MSAAFFNYSTTSCHPLFVTTESIIEQTYCSENLPQPLFAKEGKFLPFVKGERARQESSLPCLQQTGAKRRGKNLVISEKPDVRG